MQLELKMEFQSLYHSIIWDTVNVLTIFNSSKVTMRCVSVSFSYAVLAKYILYDLYLIAMVLGSLS